MFDAEPFSCSKHRMLRHTAAWACLAVRCHQQCICAWHHSVCSCCMCQSSECSTWVSVRRVEMYTDQCGHAGRPASRHPCMKNTCQVLLFKNSKQLVLHGRQVSLCTMLQWCCCSSNVIKIRGTHRQTDRQTPDCYLLTAGHWQLCKQHTTLSLILFKMSCENLLQILTLFVDWLCVEWHVSVTETQDVNRRHTSQSADLPVQRRLVVGNR